MTAVQWTNPTINIFEEYTYPGWANGIGWFLVVLPIIFIPVVFVVVLLKEGGWQVMFIYKQSQNHAIINVKSICLVSM